MDDSTTDPNVKTKTPESASSSNSGTSTSSTEQGMDRLFRMKGARKSRRGKNASKKPLMGELRVQSDLDSLKLPPMVKLGIPDKKNILHLTLSITPHEGLYKGGKFNFTIDFPATYPHKPPKVTCTQTIYHPNIDTDGAICLNILREDWKPVLSLSSVVLGLVFLFEAPNPDDPLNHEAARIMRERPDEFTRNIKNSMRGNTFGNVHYSRVLT